MRTRVQHFFALLILLSAATAVAQDPAPAKNAVDAATPGAAKPSDDAKPIKKPLKAAKAGSMLTPEREAAALAFAGQHHPELVELLTPLKQHNRAEYQNAMRELFRTSERLAQVHERDAERYALELAAWRIQPRTQLLAARLSMSPSQTLETELRAALAEYADLRIKILELDRGRIGARLQKLDEDLAAARQHRERDISQRYDVLLRGLGKQRVKAAGDKSVSDDKNLVGDKNAVEKPAKRSEK